MKTKNNQVGSRFPLALLTVLLSLVATNAMAYDIAVENEDGVTIYYNYFNEGKELEVAKCDYSGVVIIPEEVTFMNRTRKVTSIEDEAFKGCSDMISVTIPNSMTTIGEYAFEDCYGLTSIAIPSSVTTIKQNAFWKCGGLKSVHITDLAAWCNIDFTSGDSNPLFNAHHLFLNNEEVKDLVIPDGVTSIKHVAFYSCTGLTSVTIPNSVTTIGQSALAFCSGLTSVTIPNSVTSIGQEAFAYCSGLTSVTIPNSVTSIGQEAFSDCSGLTSVTIGNNVNNIGQSAFYGEDILEIVSLIKEPFEFKDSPFTKNTIYNATLYVPAGTYDKYKSTKGWKDFVFIEEIGEQAEEKKCEAPIISYMDGQLAFETATVGAECHWAITDEDISKGSGNLVDLTATYHVTAYATRPGWDNSDTAEATLCWIETEPQQGIVTEKLEIPAIPVLIKSREGVVTIEGLADGTQVSLYGTDGSLLGMIMSSGKTATISTSLPKGTIVLVKIGDKAVKVSLN